MRLRSIFLVPVILPLLVACGGDDSDSSSGGAAGAPDAGPDTGGAAGQAGSGGAAGAAGGAAGAAGAAEKDNRGDPTLFPSDCLESCKEACEKLESCGAQDSSTYPIEQADCLDRCVLGLTSPYGIWEDVSGNFRCCASQDACYDVATCGGWLKHPDPGPSCAAMCECLAAYMTVPEWPADVKAPAGYQFAPNAVAFAGAPTLDVKAAGAELVSGGHYTLMRFSRPIDASSLQKITGGRRTLPTFYDAEGRLAAAVGDIFVRIQTKGHLAQLKAKAKAAGLAAPVPVRYGKNLYRIDSTDAWKSLRALPAIAATQGVVRAELDMVRKYVKNYVPNDPRFAEQWHLHNTGENGTVPGVDGRVSEAWDLTTGDPNVIIAINDDGVNINHPDLAADCTEGLNFPADWEDKLGDLAGFGNHGTSVAGVAAAIGDNNEGGAGVCPGCKIMPHMVGESVGPSLQMTDQEIADGFALMVDEGAWVINNSWGAGGGDPNFVTTTFPIPPTPQVVKDAFAYAESDGRGGLGTVIVYAAGNENEPIAAYAKEATVVTVTAVDDQGLKSYYSSHGPEADIAAPSNGGLLGIVTTEVEGAYTDSFGGTSSASPFVAGVAGLVLSANPDLTAQQVRDILGQSATKIDLAWGAYDTNGHSDFYGAGLVNAYVAVQMALGCTDLATCQAPSDDCGTDCDKPACSVCRTTEECADGHICLSLATLGQSVCVAEDGGAACPTGTTAHDGYCIPDRDTCNLCGTAEICNGIDDDCNGQVDDGLNCGSQRVLACPVLDEGCSADESCAATRCVDACTDNSECDEDSECLPVKNRYGAEIPGAKGCAVSLAGTCKVGCEVLASSMSDTEIEGFVTCMDDGEANCFAAYSCAQQLPINF